VLLGQSLIGGVLYSARRFGWPASGWHDHPRRR